MRVVTISHVPLSVGPFEEAGCRLIAETSADDTFFAPLACPEADRRLTRRQTEVLQLMAQGLSVAEVAGRLHVSRKTIERHLRNCRQRLAAANDVQLGVVTQRLGL